MLKEEAKYTQAEAEWGAGKTAEILPPAHGAAARDAARSLVSSRSFCSRVKRFLGFGLGASAVAAGLGASFGLGAATTGLGNGLSIRSSVLPTLE